MKHLATVLFFIAVLFAAAPAALAQNQQEPDMDEIIDKQIENLTRMFDLDEVQVFFVDSILRYNFPAMSDEFDRTRKTGASNADTFQAISDKWMAATDEAFERLFTEEQWKRYMKSTYGKEKNRRDKRIKERVVSPAQ